MSIVKHQYLDEIVEEIVPSPIFVPPVFCYLEATTWRRSIRLPRRYRFPDEALDSPRCFAVYRNLFYPSRGFAIRRNQSGSNLVPGRDPETREHGQLIKKSIRRDADFSLLREGRIVVGAVFYGANYARAWPFSFKEVPLSVHSDVEVISKANDAVTRDIRLSSPVQQKR